MCCKQEQTSPEPAKQEARQTPSSEQAQDFLVQWPTQQVSPRAGGAEHDRAGEHSHLERFLALNLIQQACVECLPRILLDSKNPEDRDHLVLTAVWPMSQLASLYNYSPKHKTGVFIFSVQFYFR